MRPSRLCLFFALFMLTITANACTTAGKNRTATKNEATSRSGKIKIPKSYSLFRNRQLNHDMLRRGQKVMASPALDSY